MFLDREHFMLYLLVLLGKQHELFVLSPIIDSSYWDSLLFFSLFLSSYIIYLDDIYF